MFAGIDNFFHMMVSNEPGKAKRYTVFLVEVKENMKLCVEKAQAYERERKRVSKTREVHGSRPEEDDPHVLSSSPPIRAVGEEA